MLLGTMHHLLNYTTLNCFRHVNVGTHLFILDLVMYLNEKKLSDTVVIVFMTQNEQYIHPSIHPSISLSLSFSLTLSLAHSHAPPLNPFLTPDPFLQQALIKDPPE